MKHYINTVTGVVQTTPGFVTGDASGFAGKAGSDYPINLQFVDNFGVPSLLPGGSTIVFTVKPQGKWNSLTPLTQITSWSVPGSAAGFYTAVLSFNTTPINNALGRNTAGTDLADIEPLVAMGEYAWQPGGTGDPIKSNTLVVTINNAVNNGLEGTPGPGDQSYPPVANLEVVANKGAASGYCPLNSSSQVARTYLDTELTKINAAATAVASASTTAIFAATGDYVSITGTTLITAFDTATAGETRKCVTAGALVLTSNSAILLPGGANITTAAGDSFTVVSNGSGVARVISYQRASGVAVVAVTPSASSITTGVLPIAQLPALPKFRAKASGPQAVPYNTATKLLFDVASLNTGGDYNASTSQWTPPAGTYAMGFNMPIDSGGWRFWIYKNGSLSAWITEVPGGVGMASGNTTVAASGTDYFEFWVINYSGSTANVYSSESTTDATAYGFMIQ